MPRYDISPRERKLQERQTRQQTNIQGQQASQQNMTSMLAQLAQLYGLDQAQQADPLKLQNMGLENASKQFEVQHAPELLQSKLGADRAQQDYYSGKSQNQLTPHDLMQYEMTTGHGYVTPEQHAIEAQKAEEERQAGQVEEARIAALAAAQPKHQAQGVGGLLGTALHGVANIPEALQNLDTSMSGGDFWQQLFNLTPQPATHPIKPDAQGKRSVSTRAWPWQTPKATQY